MPHPSPSDAYIAAELLPRIPSTMERLRAYSIDEERERRCLTPIGHSLFHYAVICYLARRREEGDELVVKAREFLRLARSIGERQRYDYVRRHSEAERAADLSYVDWLATDEVNAALVAEARADFAAYYARPRPLLRRTVSFLAPVLLYTESYPLLRKLAESFPPSPGRAGGLFDHAVRIASAEDEARRQVEKKSLRRKIPRQVFAWIDKGQFPNVAFALLALFPRPEGPPHRLIEDCWKSIPESVIKKCLAAR